MATIWTKSKWTYKDIEKKRVEFHVPAFDGIAHGFGRFLVRQNREGLLTVDIAVEIQKTPWSKVHWRIHLPQEAVNQIKKHPESTADFQLVF